jgi:lipocalin-like protein
MRDKLVGTWTLVSVRPTRSTGERNDAPYRAHPSGFITYTPEDRMSAIIGFDGRSPLSVDEWYRAPAGERAEAFSTFLAYRGSYSVMPDRVIYHVDVASIENWVNTDLVRMVKFAGETIILSALPAGVVGNAQIYELTWGRMADGSH